MRVILLRCFNCTAVNDMKTRSGAVKYKYRIRQSCSVCRSYPGIYSEAGIATGYGPDDAGAGIRVPVGSRSLCFPGFADRF
jgi:hypothetical protein